MDEDIFGQPTRLMFFIVPKQLKFASKKLDETSLKKYFEQVANYIVKRDWNEKMKWSIRKQSRMKFICNLHHTVYSNIQLFSPACETEESNQEHVATINYMAFHIIMTYLVLIIVITYFWLDYRIFHLKCHNRKYINWTIMKIE